MKINKVSLKETTELEPLVKSSITDIEEGLVVLDNQITIGASGRPDILAIDHNSALSIIELKSVPATESAVSQILRYYEWFVKNLALFARPFPNINTDEAIRLFIVAPEFKDEVKTLSKYLNLNITLTQYTAIKNIDNNDLGIIFEDIALSPEEGPGVALRSIDDIVKYFTNDDIRIEFNKVLDDLRDSNVSINPYNAGKHHWIECKYQEDDIGYFQPRQRYFNCQIYDETEEKYIWPPIKLFSYDEWVDKCKESFMCWVEDE
jgi:hypothetical protein